MRFNNTTALVTGASSGIGREFARAFASRGANLVLVARRADVLDDIAHAFTTTYGITVTTIPFDLSQSGSGTALLTELTDGACRSTRW